MLTCISQKYKDRLSAQRDIGLKQVVIGKMYSSLEPWKGVSGSVIPGPTRATQVGLGMTLHCMCQVVVVDWNTGMTLHVYLQRSSSPLVQSGNNIPVG